MLMQLEEENEMVNKENNQMRKKVDTQKAQFTKQLAVVKSLKK